MYEYEQDLLAISSNQPVIVGSPKLFRLMDESDGEREKRIIGEGDHIREVDVRKIIFNDRIIELVRLGDIADVKVGLQTGDNDYYLYQKPEARGNYKNINDYKKYLLTEDDLVKIRGNEGIREKVIQLGIHQSKDEDGFDKDRWFGGRFISPYDKGGESDTDAGWLPNYSVPTEYFIDWSTKAVTHLLNQRLIRSESTLPYPRNIDYYFKDGITYSPTGIYSPTYRRGSAAIFGHKGSSIFPNNTTTKVINLLGILNSKLYKYLLKTFSSHTVETREQSILDLPILEERSLGKLVENIVKNQTMNPKYNFMLNEQKDIDQAIYSVLEFKGEDVNEIETWFARRYPKLANYAYFKPKEELAEEEEDKKISPADRIKELIAQEESRNLEFKSSLRYDVQQKGVPAEVLEHSVFKNIAAFLNTEGGTILIGVEDNQNIIGLENTDYKTFQKGNKKDELLKHIDNLVQNYFGDHVHHNLRMEFGTFDGKTVCMIEVISKAGQPVFLKQKNKPDEFYIRRFASAKALTVMESVNYIKEHWK